MHRRSLRFGIPATLVTLFLTHPPAAAKRLGGVFTAVKDANVVILDYGEGSYDVRLYGTEAPADGQPFAAEAKAFVREALLGKNGAMRFKYRNAKEQMVARVFYTDAQGVARDLSVELAAAGLAWLRPGARYRPAEEGQVDELTAAQAEAQRARRGVWSVPNPVAPWTYRGETLEAEGETSGSPEGTSGTVDKNISKLSGSDNECAIAKDPSNPLRLAAHCNSLPTPWISSDGGQTWTTGGSIGSYCCDPNLAFDSFGNLFATFIDSAISNIVTKVSVNGGVSFSPVASFFCNFCVDQPSVVAYDGTVWIVWNNNSVMVARGAAVTGLGTIGAFSAMQTAATTGACTFGDLATSPVSPHAVVQVCGPDSGENGGSIRINIDADGLGAGVFGASIVAATTLVGGFDEIPAQSHRTIDTE
ncbi:MAG: thermonuclease family protein, partial [Thermoanaerobaculia bacterium]|nr:thermonuclease family protein [Thermoanaerobaculia bacterium]